MSFFAMASNTQEVEASSLKRCHDEFIGPGCGEVFRLDDAGLVGKLAGATDTDEKENHFPSALTSLRPSPPRKGSPIHSPFTNPTQTNSAQDSPPTTLPHPPPSAPSLNPSSNPPTNSVPTPTQNSTADHPAKRKRLSKEEKAVKDLEMVKRKEEREADKAAKAADKAKKDAEKAKRDTEKAKKDADRKRRAEEKEKERREREEEEARKVRSQLKLNSFFKINPATPKPNAAIKPDAVDDASPSGTPKKGAAKETSVYEQVFKPFFIKDQVTVAPVSYLDMDHETKEAKSQILEEYINEKRGHVEVKPFDPVETLQLPCRGRRGRIYPSVRKIMSGFLHDEFPPKVIDLSTESQNTQIRQTREALRAVPMKFLGFKQDVRPPYFGTVTNYPSGMASLRRLGRNPLAKDILPLNYDYDSEAEWQEDDGEDVDAMDDDEEDPDNDEDMGDFLDDSEDAGLLRPAFSGGMEPESTGICWENRQREAPLPHMRDFQMEFILESLDHHSGIDPFSSHYWEPAPSTTLTFTPAPAASSSAMAPPPGPVDAFHALATPAAAAPKKAPTLAPDMKEKLKELVMANPALSKVGTIELFSSQHAKCSKTAIKATLEMIAEKAGKAWRLKPGV